MNNNETETLELENNHPNFIESNTEQITLSEIAEKCIVPTFSDNSLTISHMDFCGSVYKAAERIFGALTPIETRVSHAINGRVPTALEKKACELTDDEKTLYYQRLAFVAHVHSCTRNIDGQEINLTIGGVRSYSEDKLFGRPSAETFRIFVGWKVRVCSNLMLQNDGYTGSIECLTSADIHQKALELFSRFDPVKDNNLNALARLQDTRMTEEQFCHIIGRMRLLQALPVAQQKALPQVLLGDQAINEATRQFVSNPNFGRKEGIDGISTFEFMQLLTESAKGSYIDRWLDRNANAIEFSQGISKALQYEDTDGYDWFLN